jgi:hypothetical protein
MNMKSRFCIIVILFLAAFTSFVRAEEKDRFLQLVRRVNRNFEVRPVIINGRHALEATVSTSINPQSILNQFDKFFEDNKLEHKMSHPTASNPVGLFSGVMEGEEKQMAIIAATTENCLIRVTSYQKELEFKQRYPSVVAKYQEFEKLGKPTLKKETFNSDRHTCVMVIHSKESSRQMYDRARSELKAIGWEEGITQHLKEVNPEAAKKQLCILKKGATTAMLVGTGQGETASVVITTSSPFASTR